MATLEKEPTFMENVELWYHQGTWMLPRNWLIGMLILATSMRSNYVLLDYDHPQHHFHGIPQMGREPWPTLVVTG